MASNILTALVDQMLDTSILAVVLDKRSRDPLKVIIGA